MTHEKLKAEALNIRIKATLKRAGLLDTPRETTTSTDRDRQRKQKKAARQAARQAKKQNRRR